MNRFASAAAIIGISLSVIAIYIVYDFRYGIELDSRAEYGPLNARMLTVDDNFDIPVEINLAAGLSYDADNDWFLVSTDEPHTLLPVHQARVFVLDSTFTSILRSHYVQSDSDLEGITTMGSGRIATLSELGKLTFLQDDGADGLTEIAHFKVFDEGGHKLGSLAYDHTNHHFYTAEKEGGKTIYKIDEQGKLLESFELRMPKTFAEAADECFNFDDDYTIAGMQYIDEKLYIFSEAYSTVFVMEISTQQITDVIGFPHLPESSGMTIRNGKIYFIGDQEDYLPAPKLHVAALISQNPAR